MTQTSFWSAVRWAFVLTFGRRAFSTIFTFILAALLGPHDFGVMAIALIYITLLQVVLEQGLATALVQRDTLEREHLDAAFWMNFAWCLALTAAAILTSGLWASLNGEQQLKSIVQVLSALVLLEGLHIVQQAVLERELKFKRLAIRSNIASIAGGVVGLALALRGAGVWALVAQQLVLEATSLVLIWALSDWRPRLRFSWRHARELLPFSSGVFLSNLGGFVARRADALLLGIFFGPVVVGLYRLADRFVDVVLESTMRPIGLVSLPALSRVQSDPAALRERVDTFLRFTMLITAPAMLVLAACSNELLRLMGPEWEPATTALKLLCVAGIAKAIIFITGPVLFAVSRSHFRAGMQWVLAGLSAGAVVLAGLALSGVSLRHQLEGMASSRVLLLVPIMVPINLWIVARITGYDPRKLLSSVPAPLLAGAAAIGANVAVRATGLFDELPAGAAVALSGAIASTIAVAVLFLLEPQARELARLVARRVSGRVPNGDGALQAAPPHAE